MRPSVLELVQVPAEGLVYYPVDIVCDGVAAAYAPGGRRKQFGMCFRPYHYVVVDIHPTGRVAWHAIMRRRPQFLVCGWMRMSGGRMTPARSIGPGAPYTKHHPTLRRNLPGNEQTPTRLTATYKFNSNAGVCVGVLE